MGSNPILAAPSGGRWVPRLARLRGGGLAERSKAHAWKACRGATPSRVRTPQPPPRKRVTHLVIQLRDAGKLPADPGHVGRLNQQVPITHGTVLQPGHQQHATPWCWRARRSANNDRCPRASPAREAQQQRPAGAAASAPQGSAQPARAPVHRLAPRASRERVTAMVGMATTTSSTRGQERWPARPM
jgi:hypothetical protein